MRVRLKKNNNIHGTANVFNQSAINEIIVHFDDESVTSDFISEYEVLIDDKWIDMSKAFKENLLISDNYNTEFFEPKDEEEKKRGYRLTNLDLAKLQAEAYDCRFTLSGD